MDTNLIVSLLIWGGIAWGVARWWKRRKAAKMPKRWPGVGAFAVKVTGTSHYRENIASVAGAPADEHADRVCVAELDPTTSNPHDPQAVAVTVDGRMVGHLSRADASALRALLKAQGRPQAVTSCSAHIGWGGLSAGPGSERMHFAVRLDLPALAG